MVAIKLYGTPQKVGFGFIYLPHCNKELCIEFPQYAAFQDLRHLICYNLIPFVMANNIVSVQQTHLAGGQPVANTLSSRLRFIQGSGLSCMSELTIHAVFEAMQN